VFDACLSDVAFIRRLEDNQPPTLKEKHDAFREKVKARAGVASPWWSK
jgi:hypothetical protein